MATVTVPPFQEMDVPVQVKDLAECGQNELFEPTVSLRRKHGIVAPGMLVDVQENPFHVRVYNPNAQQTCLHAKTCIGLLKPCEEVRPVSSCHQVLKSLEAAEGPRTSEEEPGSPGERNSTKDEKWPSETQVGQPLQHKMLPANGTLRLPAIPEDDQLEAVMTADQTEPPEKPIWDENGVRSHVSELYKRSVAGVPEEFHERIKKLINEYEDIFRVFREDVLVLVD